MLSTQDLQLATSMKILSLAQCYELCEVAFVSVIRHVLPSHTWEPGVGQNVGITYPYVVSWKRPMLLCTTCMTHCKGSAVIGQVKTASRS